MVSTAWGGPREKVTQAQVVDYIDILAQHAAGRGFPIHSITLADTVGKASPGEIGDLIRQVKAAWPELVVRAHLHPAIGTAEESIDAALEAGIDQWEAAWGGVGGSPFTEKPGANMDIRSLVKVNQKRGLDHGLNIEEMERTIQFLRQRTTREIVDIKI